MTIAVFLALIVFVMGGVVLYLKLKPQPAPSTMSGALLDTAQGLVDANPSSSFAHTALGMAYLRLGRTQDAQDQFEQSLKLDKNDWGANLQLALLTEGSDPARAAQLLTTSAKYAPSSETPYLELGNLYFRQGKYEDAKVAYLQSVAADGTLYDSRMGLGRTYQALGQKRLAAEQYKQALRFIPGDQAAEDALASLAHAGATTPAASPSASP